MTENLSLETKIGALKGVGPVREKALASLGVTTVKDILLHLPRKYEDRRHVTPIGSLVEGRNLLVSGKVVHAASTKKPLRSGGGRLAIHTAVIEEAGKRLTCSWFNRRGGFPGLLPGSRVALFGKAEQCQEGWKMNNPDLEILLGEERPQAGILPLYPLSKGLTQKFLRKLTRDLFDSLLAGKLLTETLPERILVACELVGLAKTVEWLHYPKDENSWKAARKRAVFEEFFCLQVKFKKARRELAEKGKAPIIRRGDLTNRFLVKKLPYKLTLSQRNAVREIWGDLEREIPMRRLLHGEVGSGKTVVALGAAVAAAESGQQVAFLVPTEVLARQHYTRTSELLAGLGIACGILAGSNGNSGGWKAKGTPGNGKPGIYFGTHALFQPKVGWKRLGLVIVDEQHRFGVAQKAALLAKGKAPHLLVMSATPIPRTLTLTAYGELDVTKLEGPLPGRKKARTFLLGKENLGKLMERVGREVSSGGQVLWVCPQLEEQGPETGKSVFSRLQEIREALPELSAGVVHGQMPSSEKLEAMQMFERGKLGILVATTVVEVGIDVPGATMIIVEDAERFGLSQLHQLRGRVGRGEREGICVLFSSPGNMESLERLKLMTRTDDGLAVAEADLLFRGPGALCGFRQHGVTEFRVGDLRRDRNLLEMAREEVRKLGENDPLLKASFFFSFEDECREEMNVGPVMG